MMEARLIVMAVVCLCIAQMAFAKNQSFSFLSNAKEQQFVKILKGVRCSVCKTQSVFDSDTKAAEQMRAQIYELFIQGKSKHQIHQFLRATYGQNILFMPTFGKETLILWFLPIVALFAAGMGVFVFYSKHKLVGNHA